MVYPQQGFVAVDKKIPAFDPSPPDVMIHSAY
jgi:hypothetical protein